MSGPWDDYATIQTDGAAVGPWQEYTPSIHAASEADKIIASPVARFGRGVASLPIAIGQAGANLYEAAAHAAGRESTIGQQVNQALKDYEEAERRGMKALGNEGTNWMGLLGSLASGGAVGKVVSKALPVATTALVSRMGAGAVQGGVAGVSQPVTEGDEYWRRKAGQGVFGAGIGAAVPVAGAVLGGVADFARKAVEPLSEAGRAAILKRFYSEMAPEGLDKIKAALYAAKPLVPGSHPTAGEAMADLTESAGLAAAQAGFRGVPGLPVQKFAAREAAQVDAHREALHRIAKTPQDLESAITQRADDAAVNYGAAFRDPSGALRTVKTDKAFDAILQRPSMQKALPRAQEIAEEQGLSFQAPRAWGTPIQYPVESLHLIKESMDDLLKGSAQSGIGAIQARAIAGTRAQLLDWIKAKSPDYDHARQVFADESMPINRMLVGQELETALTKATGAGERVGMFTEAVRNAASLLKRATGGTRFEKLDDILSPSEMQEVQAVADDLSRQAKFAQLAKIPSGISVKTIADEVTIPTLLSRPAMIGNFLLKLQRKDADTEIAKLASEQMLDPQRLAQFLETTPPTQRQQIIDAMMARLPTAATVGAATAFGREQ